MPGTFAEHHPILTDECLAAEYHVGRAFAESAAGIDVAGQETCALLAYQRAEVVILSCAVGTCAEVEDDVGSLQGQGGGRRYRGPDVLTQFDAERAARGLEQLVGGQEHLLSADEHVVFRYIHRADEPPLVIELLVVRQERLGHQAQQLTLLQNSRAVHQSSLEADRQADDGDDIHRSREVH